MADSPEKKPLDLSSILFPKKDAPGATPDSAQRVNAGALFEQEQKAASDNFPAQRTSVQENSPPQKEEVLVKPLQTFQGDIEKVVQQKNVSVVSVAAAEAERRSAQPLGSAPEQKPTDWNAWKKTAMIGGGALLIVAALSLTIFAFLPNSNPAVEQSDAPFILVEQTIPVAFSEANIGRSDLMNEFVRIRDSLALSLGLVANIKTGVASTSGDMREFSTQEFFSYLSNRIPESLTRTLDPAYVLGLHSYDGNQPFLLLKTDSYESAFAGLLAWELMMVEDLKPLFDRKLPPRVTPIPPPSEPIATSTASSTSTSTPFRAPVVVIPTEFMDRIIENHDARVVQNEYGDVLLLWTFLDRQTIIITTNEATVREVLRRLTEAPIIPIE